MSTDFTAFRALVRKDIAIFLRDRRALVVSVVTPIVIAAFFGFLFGGTGSGDVVSRLPVAMVDLDSSPLSKAVVDSLAQDPALAVKSLTEAEARQQVQRGKMRAAVVLPAGFGAAAPAALFGAGQKPAVDVYYDPSQSIVLPLVTGLLTQHVMDQVMRTLPSGQGMSAPFTLASVGVSTGPRYNSYAHSFAGMSVQFILFMGIDAGVALILMRKAGMWQRLRAAPLSRGVLLGSRVVGTTLIAQTILAAVYTVAIAVFGVRIAGSVPGFILVAAAFALLAAATGLMIASVGRSEGATRGVAIFVVLLLVMLGGAWVPAFLFPQWLQRVSDFTPTRWAVDGLDAMTWRGLPLHAAFAPAAVVLGWAVLFGLIAVWRFDWEGE